MEPERKTHLNPSQAPRLAPDPTYEWPVDILLLTYNQQEYLGDLLHSVSAQSYASWRLIALDNGSSDGSPALLEQFARRHGSKVCLLPNPQKINFGPCQGFARLLEASAAPYAMFCDGDDVWLSRKVELTLGQMREAEQRCTPRVPVLVHTDLSVTDARLNILAPSFSKYQNLDPARGRRFSHLLMQNCVTGCTAMVNQPLRQLALPIAPQAAMHDWWLALTAAAFGVVAFIPESTVLYRQHGNNVLGAQRWGLDYVFKKMMTFWQTEELHRSEGMAIRQALAFQERFGAKLDAKKAAALRACCRLQTAGWFGCRHLRLRHRIFKHGLIRNLGWLLRA